MGQGEVGQRGRCVMVAVAPRNSGVGGEWGPRRTCPSDPSLAWRPASPRSLLTEQGVGAACPRPALHLGPPSVAQGRGVPWVLNGGTCLRGTQGVKMRDDSGFIEASLLFSIWGTFKSRADGVWGQSRPAEQAVGRSSLGRRWQCGVVGAQRPTVGAPHTWQ